MRRNLDLATDLLENLFPQNSHSWLFGAATWSEVIWRFRCSTRVKRVLQSQQTWIAASSCPTCECVRWIVLTDMLRKTWGINNYAGMRLLKGRLGPKDRLCRALSPQKHWPAFVPWIQLDPLNLYSLSAVAGQTLRSTKGWSGMRTQVNISLTWILGV